MFDTPNEQIEVLANFTQEGPIPIIFTWRSKEYYIETINFIHSSKDGDSKLIHFAVSNEKENYKLTFNTKSLVWTLDEVYRANSPMQQAFTLKEQNFSSYMYAQRLR